MKHVRIFVLSVMVIFGSTVLAQAGQDIGQFCWTFGGGLVDRLRLSVTQADGHPLGGHVSERMFEVTAKWRAVSYQLLGSGLVAESHPTSGLFHGGIHLSNPSGSFGGNRTCTAHMSLNPAEGPNFLNGMWIITCSGGATSFTNSGTLVYDDDCSGPDVFSMNAQAQREAGDPR
ncbi:MAG TPA: hypothetical protein VFA32_01655 [Dehalococcoidia bacterium]|jgi:hypothetical protein|nr:hypothetical protein [Dehalococcoidia bacterium]